MKQLENRRSETTVYVFKQSPKKYPTVKNREGEEGGEEEEQQKKTVRSLGLRERTRAGMETLVQEQKVESKRRRNP